MGQASARAFPHVGDMLGRRKEARLVRVSLTASGAITAVSMPVTLVLFPSTAIPVAIFAALATAIVAWHLRRGGRATVRRTPKGSLSFTLDSTRRNRRRENRDERLPLRTTVPAPRRNISPRPHAQESMPTHRSGGRAPLRSDYGHSRRTRARPYKPKRNQCPVRRRDSAATQCYSREGALTAARGLNGASRVPARTCCPPRSAGDRPAGRTPGACTAVAARSADALIHYRSYIHADSSDVKPALRSSMQMMLVRFCRMHAQIGPLAHVTAGQGMVEYSMAGRRSPSQPDHTRAADT